MSEPSSSGTGRKRRHSGSRPSSQTDEEVSQSESESGAEAESQISDAESSTGRVSPQTSVQLLGQTFEDTPGESLEMDVFEPTDPFEHLYQNVAVGQVQYTQSIEQDLPVLEQQGFIIDYPNGTLGAGYFGTVYKGYYGTNAQYVKDLDGNHLRNVQNRAPFAAKLVEFSPNARDYDSLEKRESYEMEKWIMTFANHKNITQIRMAINMGEPRVFRFRNNQNMINEYIQHDRVYLIMEFAELGPLLRYMNMNSSQLKPRRRIKLITDLFWGMKYLHDSGIIHGDIHMGNALVFKEDNDICAKWTDFGLGYVDRRGQYRFRRFNDPNKNVNLERDIRDLQKIFWNCFRNRKRDQELPNERYIVDQFLEMNQLLLKANNLEEVLRQYPHILSENQPLNWEVLI